MDSRTPSDAVHRQTGILADPQLWIWGAVAVSGLICAFIGWLYFQQRDSLPRAAAAVLIVQQAKMDLAQGLVLASPVGATAVSSERERGLALLHQALSSIDGIAAEHDPAQEELRRDAMQFRERLDRWSRAPASPLDSDLRMAYDQLQRAADRVDAIGRTQLQTSLDRQRSLLAWTLSAAVLLGGGICAAVVWFGRSSNAWQRWRDSDQTNAAHLRDTFEHAAVGIAHVAPDGHLLRVNQKLCDLIGYSRQELQSKSDQDITHSQDIVSDRDFARRAAVGEIGCYSGEKRYICKDGKVVWVNRTSALVRDSKGKPDYYITVVEDIQKRKEVEAALRANEEWLRLALSASNQGLFDVDLRTWKLSLSPEYLRMIGYEPDPNVPSYDDIHSRRHPEDQERLGRIYQEYARAERTSHRAELRLQTKTGDWIWVSTTGQVVEWDDVGNPVRVVGTNSDITERKHAEEALAAERALLRTLVDALPDVVFIKDTAGRFTMGNAAAMKYLGLSQDDLVGKTVFDLFPRELAQTYHADDQCALRGEPVLNREARGLDLDGKARWYLTIKVPLRSPAGEIIGLVGMNRDITDHKNADALVRRTQKMQALGTLAGGIAHDFNNILLAITGNVSLAIADLAPDHPAQASLSEIAKAGARAADLVRRILAFSRPQEARLDTMRLEPVIDEAIKLLRSTLPAMTEIKCAFVDNVPAVSADASQIHQIMVNLITNAAHAIGGGVGLIEIRLEAVSVSADLLHASIDLREGFYARLAISDDGAGMDQATLERIFEPFFTTKPAGQGTGLGLSVVHGIMRGHGGAVTVYSQPGKGTTFHLYFPAAATETHVEPRQKRDLLPARGERVLYVDDETALVHLATRALERLGYRVSGYSEAAAALHDFQTDPQAFDVVVTDLSMPGMSGFELARAILAIRSDVPLVMTSGYVNPRDEDTARSIGVLAMILKPNTVEELGQVLDNLFRGEAIRSGERHLQGAD